MKPSSKPSPSTGGQPGASGTTERDHGGAGSWMPERAQGEDRSTQMERGRTVTDGSGPGDERGGATGAERSDSDGTLPDTGMDRDAGAGAAGGRDRGGQQASRGAQRAIQEDKGRGGR